MEINNKDISSDYNTSSARPEKFGTTLYYNNCNIEERMRKE